MPNAGEVTQAEAKRTLRARALLWLAWFVVGGIVFAIITQDGRAGSKGAQIAALAVAMALASLFLLNRRVRLAARIFVVGGVWIAAAGKILEILVSR